MPRTAKPKAPVDPEMVWTEKKLSANIVRAAKDCGWLVARTWLSKFSPAGEPDLRMVRNGRMLVWELKTDKGKVSPAQQEWLDALAQVPGLDVRVVRPADLEAAYQALVTGEWPKHGDRVSCPSSSARLST